MLQFTQAAVPLHAMRAAEPRRLRILGEDATSLSGVSFANDHAGAWARPGASRGAK